MNANFVAQLHLRNSAWTEKMCHDYKLRPVILVRRLLDVIISMRDHIRRGNNIWPMLFVEPYHANLDDAALDLMIARLAIPWYMNFYMSWREAKNVYLLSYEELIQNPGLILRDILTFANANVRADDIDAAIQRTQDRGESKLNFGVVGRGNGVHPAVIRSVLDLVDLYPEAADDPYIQSVRSQCHAALQGTHSPAPSPIANSRLAKSPALKEREARSLRRLVMHRIMPLALVTLGILYWVWPNDLIPDDRPFGYTDDILFGMLICFIAGRLTRSKLHTFTHITSPWKKPKTI